MPALCSRAFVHSRTKAWRNLSVHQQGDGSYTVHTRGGTGDAKGREQVIGATRDLASALAQFQTKCEAARSQGYRLCGEEPLDWSVARTLQAGSEDRHQERELPAAPSTRVRLAGGIQITPVTF